ncbi:hypothetical protein [Enterococcus sp. AZ109]|uniref:hypothetical protein n=1 Tax=Enterococcus sp. AZ109 TaxID=2774634 RepID=UPI003F26D729
MIVIKRVSKFLERTVFRTALKPRQILLYKTDQPKRKIFYDPKYENLGYVADTENYAGASIVSTSSIIFYIFYRTLNITIYYQNPILAYLLSSLLGLGLGWLIIYVKNRSARNITIKSLKKIDSLDNVVMAAKKQYKANIGVLYLFAVGSIFIILNILDRDNSPSLLLNILLWIWAVYSVDYFDFFRRKRLYNQLSKIIAEGK